MDILYNRKFRLYLKIQQFLWHLSFASSYTSVLKTSSLYYQHEIIRALCTFDLLLGAFTVYYAIFEKDLQITAKHESMELKLSVLSFIFHFLNLPSNGLFTDQIYYLAFPGVYKLVQFIYFGVIHCLMYSLRDQVNKNSNDAEENKLNLRSTRLIINPSTQGEGRCDPESLLVGQERVNAPSGTTGKENSRESASIAQESVDVALNLQENYLEGPIKGQESGDAEFGTSAVEIRNADLASAVKETDDASSVAGEEYYDVELANFGKERTFHTPGAVEERCESESVSVGEKSCNVALVTDQEESCDAALVAVEEDICKTESTFDKESGDASSGVAEEERLDSELKSVGKDWVCADSGIPLERKCNSESASIGQGSSDAASISDGEKSCDLLSASVTKESGDAALGTAGEESSRAESSSVGHGSGKSKSPLLGPESVNAALSASEEESFGAGVGSGEKESFFYSQSTDGEESCDAESTSVRKEICDAESDVAGGEKSCVESALLVQEGDDFKLGSDGVENIDTESTSTGKENSDSVGTAARGKMDDAESAFIEQEGSDVDASTIGQESSYATLDPARDGNHEAESASIDQKNKVSTSGIAGGESWCPKFASIGYESSHPESALIGHVNIDAGSAKVELDSDPTLGTTGGEGCEVVSASLGHKSDVESLSIRKSSCEAKSASICEESVNSASGTAEEDKSDSKSTSIELESDVESASIKHESDYVKLGYAADVNYEAESASIGQESGDCTSTSAGNLSNFPKSASFGHESSDSGSATVGQESDNTLDDVEEENCEVESSSIEHKRGDCDSGVIGEKSGEAESESVEEGICNDATGATKEEICDTKSISVGLESADAESASIEYESSGAILGPEEDESCETKSLSLEQVSCDAASGNTGGESCYYGSSSIGHERSNAGLAMTEQENYTTLGAAVKESCEIESASFEHKNNRDSASGAAEENVVPFPVGQESCAATGEEICDLGFTSIVKEISEDTLDAVKEESCKAESVSSGQKSGDSESLVAGQESYDFALAKPVEKNLYSESTKAEKLVDSASVIFEESVYAALTEFNISDTELANSEGNWVDGTSADFQDSVCVESCSDEKENNDYKEIIDVPVKSKEIDDPCEVEKKDLLPGQNEISRQSGDERIPFGASALDSSKRSFSLSEVGSPQSSGNKFSSILKKVKNSLSPSRDDLHSPPKQGIFSPPKKSSIISLAKKFSFKKQTNIALSDSHRAKFYVTENICQPEEGSESATSTLELEETKAFILLDQRKDESGDAESSKSEEESGNSASILGEEASCDAESTKVEESCDAASLKIKAGNVNILLPRQDKDIWYQSGNEDISISACVLDFSPRSGSKSSGNKFSSIMKKVKDSLSPPKDKAFPSNEEPISQRSSTSSIAKKLSPFSKETCSSFSEFPKLEDYISEDQSKEKDSSSETTTEAQLEEAPKAPEQRNRSEEEVRCDESSKDGEERMHAGMPRHDKGIWYQDHDERVSLGECNLDNSQRSGSLPSELGTSHLSENKFSTLVKKVRDSLSPSREDKSSITKEPTSQSKGSSESSLPDSISPSKKETGSTSSDLPKLVGDISEDRCSEIGSESATTTEAEPEEPSKAPKRRKKRKGKK